MLSEWFRKPRSTCKCRLLLCESTGIFFILMLSCCLCFCAYACLRTCCRVCVRALRRSRCCSCRGATARCPSRLTWSCSRGCGTSCWSSFWWSIFGVLRVWSWSPCPSSLLLDTRNTVLIEFWLSWLSVFLSLSMVSFQNVLEHRFFLYFYSMY